MRVKFHCEGCGRKYEVPEAYVGKRVRCKKCDHLNIVQPKVQGVEDLEKEFIEMSSNPSTEIRLQSPNPGRDDIESLNLKEEKAKCPFCDGEISSSAAKCQHCGEFLVEVDNMPLSHPMVSRITGRYTHANFFDRVLRLSFSFAKGISAIIVIVCLLIAVFGTIAVFFITTNAEDEKLDTPTFSEYLKLKQKERQSQEQAGNRQTSSDTNNYDSFNSPSWGEYSVNKFDSLIDDLCRDYDLNKSQLLEWLRYMNADCREAFITGLSSFLGESKEYFGKSGGGNINYAKGAMYYKSMFDKKLDELENVKLKNTMKRVRAGILRKSLLLAVASALGLLLSFLILPLLIQIERNTRILADQ
ncbi:MAG: hypothetical protein JRI56_09485 [Deltaproteobacteria bacterium]|nr:hypothetical protein [Deltaproteobacteria bacterium]